MFLFQNLCFTTMACTTVRRHNIIVTSNIVNEKNSNRKILQRVDDSLNSTGSIMGKGGVGAPEIEVPPIRPHFRLMSINHYTNEYLIKLCPVMSSGHPSVRRVSNPRTATIGWNEVKTCRRKADDVEEATY